nr:Transcription factor domain containing protein [Haemonchus contortus]
MAKRELEQSTTTKRELEQPSCSGSISCSSAKRARFSIDTLLEERHSPPEYSDCSPCPSPNFPNHDAKAALSKSVATCSTSTTTSASSDRLDGIECRLEGAELWEKFYELGTEMIITKSGRRMFPTVKVSISNIDTDGLYYVFLDVIPVDNKRYRYIYNKSAWLTAGKAEPAPKNRLYLHPDSPYTGEQLLKQVVSFEKAKLTNNEIDKAGHLILNSMHKYQPRIHIVRRNKGQHLDHNKINLTEEVHRTFVFPETQFMAVTAYQNQLITKLKIEKNPFAKGFRDPSGRSPEYEPDSRPDLPLIMPMYNPVIFQQALLGQYYLKAAAARVMPSLNPSMLSHVLFSQMPSLPNSSDLALNVKNPSPAKSESLPI